MPRATAHATPTKTGVTTMPSESDVRRLKIERDPDRARLSATEVEITAYGVQLPSGVIYIEWNRDAFEPDDRAEGLVHSRYENITDAEQATAGNVVFIDESDGGDS